MALAPNEVAIAAEDDPVRLVGHRERDSSGGVRVLRSA
jgi:hypothetical protein